MQRIAVIGAGIAGLSLTKSLAPHAQVTVFEKARGVGGRMSARYAEPYAFDHGAQYFTARTPEFQRFLAPLIDQGTVSAWEPAVVALAPGTPPRPIAWTEPHYVACPNMNGLCKTLAAGLDVRVGTEIAPLRTRNASGWTLFDIAGQALGTFDRVVSTAPYPQTARLLADVLPPDSPLPERTLLPCFALMLGLSQPWQQPWHAAMVSHSPIAWLALNSSKPGRNNTLPSLVVHAAHDWSIAQLEAEPAAVEATLMEALVSLGISTDAIVYRSLHRWRYALAESAYSMGPYYNASLGLAAAGDWTGAARVEDAWAQAAALAELLVRDTR